MISSTSFLSRNCDRAFHAATQTAGLVHTNHAWLVELEFGDPAFGIVEHLRCALVIATDLIVCALVAANKDVMFEIAHGAIRKE